MRGRPRISDLLDDEPVPPPDYGAGKWYTPAELRRVNKELAKVGRRICVIHQGVALPLDDDHFSYADRKTGRRRNQCKECLKPITRQRQREHYHRSEKRRQQMRQAWLDYYQRNHEQIREQERQRRLHQKADRLAAVLERAS